MGKRPPIPPTSAAVPAAPAQQPPGDAVSAAPSSGPVPLPATIPTVPSEASARQASEDRRHIEAIRAGSTTAWKPLLLAHQDRLFGLCLHMVGPNHAEDTAQEALLRIIKGLPEFDGRSSFATWSTRITVNACLGFLRSNKIRKMASLDAFSENQGGFVPPGHASAELPSGELSPEERIESKASDELVGFALAMLDLDKRTVLVLRDVRGLDYAQIAEVLETTEGTVKSRLFRAREALAAAVSLLGSRPPPRSS